MGLLFPKLSNNKFQFKLSFVVVNMEKSSSIAEIGVVAFKLVFLITFLGVLSLSPLLFIASESLTVFIVLFSKSIFGQFIPKSFRYPEAEGFSRSLSSTF